MSDILIKGMKMPHDGEFKHIRIYDNGDVTVEFSDGEAVIAHASSVPPHGDLIDRDALRSSIKESIDECHKWADEVDKDTMMYARISQSIGTFVECSLRAKAAPTIIPAEPLKEET